MDDKKSLRFTEEEKNVLFTLFGKYKDVIDIRHRRHSQSQHKQVELRKCWDAILDSFNNHADTSKRSMKQIQKFWLNSKLRKRLPDDKEGSRSPEKKSKTSDLVEVKVVSPKKSERSNSAFQALVKTCKDSDNEDDDEEDRKITLETSDEIELDANPNAGEQYEDENYDPLNDSYFQNDAITLKVINDQIDLALATPAPSSIVTIPAQASRTTLVQSRAEQSSSSSAAPPTAYITYSPQTATTIGSQNIQLVKSASGNYLITTPQSATRNSRTNQASPVNASAIIKDAESMSIQDLQKQEHLLRLREAKLRCEVQEIEKEKAKEELLQLREIHRLKIKEMEMRLRNMERS